MCLCLCNRVRRLGAGCLSEFRHVCWPFHSPLHLVFLPSYDWYENACSSQWLMATSHQFAAFLQAKAALDNKGLHIPTCAIVSAASGVTDELIGVVQVRHALRQTRQTKLCVCVCVCVCVSVCVYRVMANCPICQVDEFADVGWRVMLQLFVASTCSCLTSQSMAGQLQGYDWGGWGLAFQVHPGPLMKMNLGNRICSSFAFALTFNGWRHAVAELLPF